MSVQDIEEKEKEYFNLIKKVKVIEREEEEESIRNKMTRHANELS